MSTSTVRDIVSQALGKLLVLGTQDTLTDADMQTGLDGLNSMLDSWWTQRLACYALATDTKVLSGGVSSYTIGSGGDINTTRPEKFEDAFIRNNNVDYPLDIISQPQYDSIAYKLTTGIPRKMVYNAAYPLATITLYPVPSSAYTLYLRSPQQIRSFAAISDSILLPPGYARALVYNLAVELAPDYGRVCQREIVNVARESLRVLKRLNSPQLVAPLDAALRPSRGVYDITSDQMV